MGELIRVDRYNPNFKDFYFLTGVIENNGLRPIFNHVHSDSEELVATEGRRLFLIKYKLPEGNYELLKRNKREILLHKSDSEMKFPNYKLLFPEGWEQHKKLDSISIYSSEIFKSYLKIHKVLSEKYYLNFNYLKSLDSGQWDVYIPPANNEEESILGIFFTNKDKTKIAIIMPLVNR